jgi:broad specificity phosphatase PhoE
MADLRVADPDLYDLVNHEFEKPLPIEYNDLLMERRNPSEIVGKSVNDPEVKKIVDHIDKSYHSDDYRFSDEENFSDLKTRARNLLEYLAGRREKTLVVVTHGIFLRMVVAYIIHGESLDARQYNLISFNTSANNASITVCEYRKGWFGPPKDKRWQVLAWDDYTR